jgi:hypothetical protein
MTAVAMIVLAGGLGQVVDASLTVLADIAMGIGALFMLSVALFTVTYLLARLDERKHPITVVIAPMLTEPETVIDDALPLFFKHEKRLSVVRDDTAAGSFWDD